METINWGLILGICGLVGIFLIFVVVAVLFALFKHKQYMKEAKTHMKVIMLPNAGPAYPIIVEKGSSNTVLKVPNTHENTLPMYFYNKSNVWPTKYPETPFLGLGFLQVYIDTVWYYENNPEPTTSNILTPLMTATSIYAATETEMELLIKKVSSTIASLEKKLMDALTSKMNKWVVYFALIIIVIMQIVCMIYAIQANTHISTLAETFGVK